MEPKDLVDDPALDAFFNDKMVRQRMLELCQYSSFMERCDDPSAQANMDADINATISIIFNIYQDNPDLPELSEIPCGNDNNNYISEGGRKRTRRRRRNRRRQTRK